MIVLVVRCFLRRFSLSGTPAVTFGSVHIHIVAAKKRDVSTDLLRLHAHMTQQDVDFIGDVFNMSAFSVVVMCSQTQGFSAIGNSLLWSFGSLEDANCECIGFLIMPKRPCEWRVDSHCCYKFNNADLAFGHRDPRPIFLFSYTSAPPISRA